MTNKHFLKSLGLWEETQGLFFKKRYWCLQSMHWPVTHISRLEANWLESLSEEMVKKVVERESRSGWLICTKRAVKD